MMNHIVHFFWSGPDWAFPDYLAVWTARDIHESPVWIWTHEAPDSGNRWWRKTLDLESVESRPIGKWADEAPWDHIEQLGDYVAYRCLYEYGGLYLDTDTVSIHSLWHHLTEKTALGFQRLPWHQYPFRVSCGVILSQRGAPILERVLEQIPHLRSDYYGSWGPILMTNTYFEDGSNVNLIDPKYVYPFSVEQKEKVWQAGCGLPIDAHNLHYYGKQMRLTAYEHARPGDYLGMPYHQAVVKALGFWPTR